MAKRQSFADKAAKKKHEMLCPACGNAVHFVKIVRAVKSESGTYKMKSQTTGVCKCGKKDDPRCIARQSNVIRENEMYA